MLHVSKCNVGLSNKTKSPPNRHWLTVRHRDLQALLRSFQRSFTVSVHEVQPRELRQGRGLSGHVPHAPNELEEIQCRSHRFLQRLRPSASRPRSGSITLSKLGEVNVQLHELRDCLQLFLPLASLVTDLHSILHHPHRLFRSAILQVNAGCGLKRLSLTAGILDGFEEFLRSGGAAQCFRGRLASQLQTRQHQHGRRLACHILVQLAKLNHLLRDAQSLLRPLDRVLEMRNNSQGLHLFILPTCCSVGVAHLVVCGQRLSVIAHFYLHLEHQLQHCCSRPDIASFSKHFYGLAGRFQGFRVALARDVHLCQQLHSPSSHAGVVSRLHPLGSFRSSPQGIIWALEGKLRARKLLSGS
mmetsp:Transcript_13762/g.32336  ORF Transcript_13762/g.32336 Transcript_13762/m.32336 type:complete len:357 (+) Transcript_13762:730-1800(+)